MKIVFFNRFHNGDLHISREIVSKIITKVNQQYSNVSFSYAHSNDPNLLSDIPNLSFTPLSSIDQHANLVHIGDSLYINTWYAQQNYKYMNPYGMTIDCLYAALNDTCKKLWKFSLDEISKDPVAFFPTIDYSKFSIQQSQIWLNNHPQKKIFVSNGMAMSGQATNFPMAPIISDLAKKHTDKIFILSNQEAHIPQPNVIYSSQIINKQSGSDLNENSFLTTHCDVIIGRASGAFTYAWTQQNMFQRNVKFLCFCPSPVVIYPPNPFWTNVLMGDNVHYSANFVVSGETSPAIVSSIIDKNLG